jgi:ABC-2 type transport system permease protein
MYTLIIRFFKDKKVAIFAYSLAEVLFVTMYVGIFPALKEQATKLQELLKTYPKEFFSAFQIRDIGFSTLEKFLSLEQYSLVWPMLTIILVISLAAAAIAKEIDDGTIENILAKPVSRMKLYFSRYIAGLKAFFIYAVISILCVIPVATVYGTDYNARAYLVMLGLGLLFGSAVFSFAYMLSAIFSQKSKVYALAGGVMFFMYVLNVLASLKDSLKNLQYLSLFYYYDFNTAVSDHYIRWLGVAVFLLVSGVTVTVGALWFQRRDISK